MHSGAKMHTYAEGHSKADIQAFFPIYVFLVSSMDSIHSSFKFALSSDELEHLCQPKSIASIQDTLEEVMLLQPTDFQRKSLSDVRNISMMLC